MPFKLTRGMHEEFPGAVSGLIKDERRAHFPEMEKKLRNLKDRHLLAWVIGPGGYSYHLSDPDREGRQEVSAVIRPVPGRPVRPLEHVELKQILERIGKPHEMHVMDLLPQNLELAKQVLDYEGLDSSHVSFVQGNVAEQLPPGKPHVIVCSNVLFYMSPEAAAHSFEKMLAALAPHGMLSIDFNDAQRMHTTRFKNLTRNARVEKLGSSYLIIKRS